MSENISAVRSDEERQDVARRLVELLDVNLINYHTIPDSKLRYAELSKELIYEIKKDVDGIYRTLSAQSEDPANIHSHRFINEIIAISGLVVNLLGLQYPNKEPISKTIEAYYAHYMRELDSLPDANISSGAYTRLQQRIEKLPGLS